MTHLEPASEEHLYERVVAILEDARAHVSRTVNTAMVHAYWFIGREIVEVEQRGKERAGYGEGLMRRVAERLSAKFGKGFSLASLKRMRQFYLAFSRGSALAGEAAGKGSTASSLFDGTSLLEKGSTVSSLSGPPTSALFPPSLAWSHYLVLLRVQDEQARSFYEIESARESWLASATRRSGSCGSLPRSRTSTTASRASIAPVRGLHATAAATPFRAAG